MSLRRLPCAPVWSTPICRRGAFWWTACCFAWQTLCLVARRTAACKAVRRANALRHTHTRASAALLAGRRGAPRRPLFHGHHARCGRRAHGAAECVHWRRRAPFVALHGRAARSAAACRVKLAHSLNQRQLALVGARLANRLARVEDVQHRGVGQLQRRQRQRQLWCASARAGQAPRRAAHLAAARALA